MRETLVALSSTISLLVACSASGGGPSEGTLRGGTSGHGLGGAAAASSGSTTATGGGGTAGTAAIATGGTDWISGGSSSSGGSGSGAASGASAARGGATNSGGASAARGGTTSSGGTTSVSAYSLRVDSPQRGTTVSGSVVVSGLAPGFLNVEVWDAAHHSPPLARTAPEADGTFSATVDTAGLSLGSTSWTIWAWDSLPGQSFAHDANFELPLSVQRSSGTGGAGGTGGVGSGGTVSSGGLGATGGSGGAASVGRSFLLGMFNSGSTITSYQSYLGYHPEVTYNNSYQDDHHKNGCGQPISGLDEINKYPVIPSVFTYKADYAGTARGDYDSCYTTLFQGMASKAATIYAVRIDVELWPLPAASDFKGSFNRIVSIAKQYLPARVKYIFNPNWEQDLAAGFVPESADIVGPDAYNNPEWCQGKTSAQCAAVKFDPQHAGSIAYWTKIAQQLGKPMALPEWGDDYGDGAYITAIADWAYDKVLVTAGKSNNVVYLGYWDSDMNEDGHLRGNAMVVFQQRFGHTPYVGNYWGSLIPTTTFSNF